MSQALPRKSGRFVTGYSYSPNTQIKPGEKLGVDTQFKPGEHRSEATEFKLGMVAHNKLPLGSVRIRKETHTGSLRAWVKIGEPNVWQKRSILNWERVNGPLPKGWVVHHDDRNSLNDNIENLIGMSRRDHAAEHREELKACRKS